MRASAFLLLAALGAGCSARGELEQHQEQWAKAGPAAYRYTFRPRGFLQSAGVLGVTVKEHAVVETTVDGASSRDVQGQTVEQLFTDVGHRLETDCSVTVHYDDSLGYPRDVFSECGQEGDGWQVDDLTPL